MTRPTKPAIPTTLARAGRYSIQTPEPESARPTLPPSAPDAAELAAFEESIREQGEAHARLENIRRRNVRARLPRRLSPSPEK
jgi:hypothetical protein